jgi:hypothetical protein
MAVNPRGIHIDLNAKKAKPFSRDLLLCDIPIECASARKDAVIEQLGRPDLALTVCACGS